MPPPRLYNTEAERRAARAASQRRHIEKLKVEGRLDEFQARRNKSQRERNAGQYARLEKRRMEKLAAEGRLEEYQARRQDRQKHYIERLAADGRLEEHRARRRERARLKRLESPEAFRAADLRYREKLKREGRKPSKRVRQLTPEQRARKAAHMSAWRAARGAGKSTVIAIGEALQLTLGKNTLYAAARSAVPSRYPGHVRDDIVSSIVLAVLEGELAEADIASTAKRFITAYWRDRDLFGTLSLDAPVAGSNGDLTYLDLISTENDHGASLGAPSF